MITLAGGVLQTLHRQTDMAASVFTTEEGGFPFYLDVAVADMVASYLFTERSILIAVSSPSVWSLFEG
jgi:hypothetical protein